MTHLLPGAHSGRAAAHGGKQRAGEAAGGRADQAERGRVGHRVTAGSPRLLFRFKAALGLLSAPSCQWVRFDVEQYVQSDLEADRQVATTLAELIIGGSLASVDVTGDTAEGNEAVP
jgi:hypothetical protein